MSKPTVILTRNVSSPLVIGTDAGIAADLGLVIGGKARVPAYDENHRVDFFQQLRAVQQMRGYKKGWAAHKFKDKFGTFPPWSYNDLPPIAPTDAVLRWIKSRPRATSFAVERGPIAADISQINAVAG
jgi:hypothetical protein